MKYQELHKECRQTNEKAEGKEFRDKLSLDSAKTSINSSLPFELDISCSWLNSAKTAKHS